MFELHPRLEADTKTVDDWELCRVLLMDDARYPWLILVPRIEGLRDFDEVPAVHKWRFFEEIELASRALRETSGAEKMNVAALGNMVPQLHVHVVARFEGDAAWPKPVWGVGEAEPYGPGKADLLIGKLNVTVARLAVG
ncbi:histidine triad (HIT) protein [Tepidicaulis marinus]|uniref:Histidine triad (HIT) protein n=1 Tax=Tepidicaulis marinus TaxID=1333998 RepID=A0A081BD97_9HYPH|nr:HIT domain-containing protein [Tepidicaulis marinus]GAK46015.1 histidine triad (HIT) protein [Tepidicaulis marinus]